ncbi:unnamed protein product [Schistosoma mattheei]|uniref:Uncharacterized protein n=1 Tax=Schistosoma mattheei TaxID=31246 RepID=A0A3P8KVK8_9TREM|nr:unnamed protein product [Schistosoma mattheei]
MSKYHYYLPIYGFQSVLLLLLSLLSLHYYDLMLNY